jgi:N-methylhydantoinase A/oxoprolinase/acetone carboxylase beta subunit
MVLRPGRVVKTRAISNCSGPLIVEQLDATTVIGPGDDARVDAVGNLEITVRKV